MNKLTRKILVSLVVLLVCVAIVQWARVLAFSGDRDPLRITSRRVTGNPKADIHVIEYADFRCGPCAQATAWIKNFMAEHPGALYVEFRYYPLHMAHGALDARFAECALKQDRFWAVVYALMLRQSKWISLANPKEYYLEVAKEAGMDTARLEACWEDSGVFDAVMAVKARGKELGVKATPTFFINGEMVVGTVKVQEKVNELLGLNVKQTDGTE